MLSLECGRLAKQANGAVWVQYADTVVLATALTSRCTRDIDFFPLYVDYREYQYAAGKVPGGFFKREGRPSTKEILTCRMIDRPIRPLFAKDFRDEVQIQCMALSTDNLNDPDLLGIIGASAAVSLCGVPFKGPVGAGRVGWRDGEFLINPTLEQLEGSAMDLLVCGPADGLNMIELSGREVGEDLVAEGVARAFEVCRTVVEMIEELVAQVPPKAVAYEPFVVPDELAADVESRYGQRIAEAKRITAKQERGEALAAIRDEATAQYCPEGAEAPPYAPNVIGEALFRLEGKVQRRLILDGLRPDGRSVDQVRPLGIDVGVLPRTHGSALFSRGETQALTTATLGTPRDQQIIDGLQEEYKKRFMLHYNFPPFSTGEIKPIRGPGRREIGHGALAEKSLEAVLPDDETFPYTVRLVADIMESNGSTSMAAVCGGTLAMMDAGVPIKAPVAGISIGRVAENGRSVLLTDIVGEEDFHGDMDFKVAGTAAGITGIQLDMKARFLPQEDVLGALRQAKEARLFLLERMGQVLPAPRAELNRYAPRLFVVQIAVDKIGKVIGPGGKTINRIQEETGATIDVEDDGRIYIACTDAAGAEAAKAQIEGLTAEAELGKVYSGRVVSLTDFGAFVEILPGQDGLCHVSELAAGFVKRPEDVVSVGDVIDVKVIRIDAGTGKIGLSRKALLAGQEGQDESGGQDRPQRQGDRQGGQGRGGQGGRQDDRKRRHRRHKGPGDRRPEQREDR